MTKKTGRPTTYTKALADYICGEMAEGRSLRAILREDSDMPAMSTIFLWLREHDAFSEQYTRAMDMRAQAMFEDMVEVANNSNSAERVTIKEGDDGTVKRETMIADNVQRSDLTVRTIQWALARMSPKKYGDKMQLEQKVDITNHYVDDDEEILRRHAEKYAAQQARKKSNPQGDEDGKKTSSRKRP